MDWLNELGRRLLMLSCRRRFDADLDEEMRLHRELREQEQIEHGLSPNEAHYVVRRRFGNDLLLREESRDMWGWNSVEALLHDLRYGFRQLRRNPGFTAVAVLTLALGIGANTAIFSIVNAVLLRPLPFKDPSRLVMLHEGVPQMGYPKMGFSPPDFVVFARAQKSFETIGAFRNEHLDISGQGEPERLMAARISPSLFPMLGAQPVLGRTFAPEEDAPGGHVAVLSYGLWQQRYGGTPKIIGQRVELDREAYTVIGVMPQNFVFPLSGPEDNGSPADLWVPMAFTPAELQGWGGSYFHSVVGRLRPGTTLGQAREEAKSLSRVIVANYPPALTNAFHGSLNVSASPFHEEVVGSVRTLLLVLVAAVAFVLLIACANIATLLLSRAAARQREIAIRAALGATRLRLVRQMLTESLLLALGGGALGFILAFWTKNFILAFVPASVPLPRQIPLSGSMLAFALAASFAAAVLFGLAPAFHASRTPVQDPLREGGRSGMAGRARRRSQGVFVMVEFALGLSLLIGAGLLTRSFVKLLETNPGFRPENVLTLNIPLPHTGYSQPAQIQAFYKELLGRAANLPGVQTAGLSSDLPLNAREMVAVAIEGRGDTEGVTPQAICQSWILGDYFRAMGIPLFRGRWFTPQDRLDSAPVAIVSLSMARKFWPGQDAIGERIRWGLRDPWQTIVGVAGDVRQGPLNSPLAPHVYRPYSQLPEPFLENDPFGDWHAMNLALRTQADPASLTSAVVAQVHSLDPDLAVANIRTMTQVISSSVAGPEFNTVLLGALAGLALFLAAIGIYGVLAFVVTQQTHEIGIRMALGAKQTDVLRMVLQHGMKLAITGVALGVSASLVLARSMASLLYDVRPTDPLTYTLVSIGLTSVALLASYIPARRATKVDPILALRHE